ncbi:hypothetical protein MNBD_BACTEROID01-2624 [hydrothermal vent metagenome]|uniref:Uncharacterized protein n=1 Tax=hydrothermal vent metagenome TaxID=652676 RepID=A0A3B0TZN6_9ZZZZ
MKVFSSWSGGKDCMPALYRYISYEGNQGECLYHFLKEEDTLKIIVNS